MHHLIGKHVVVHCVYGVFAGTLLGHGDREATLGDAYNLDDGKLRYPNCHKLALTGELPPGTDAYGPLPAVHVTDVGLILGFHEGAGAYRRFLAAMGGEGEADAE